MPRYEGDLSFTPRFSGDLDVERKFLFLGNDNMIAIRRFREDIFGGTFLDGATAEMTLFDISGTTVSGATFPISLDYRTGSPGIYEGVLPAADLALTEGEEYDLDVSVDSGGKQVAFWKHRLVAINRREGM